MKRHRITIKALWLDPSIGLHGFIGAVLTDGTQVAICSKEKWDMGPDDSLRKGWHPAYSAHCSEYKTFAKPKTMYGDITEDELRARGLALGGPLGTMLPFPI